MKSHIRNVLFTFLAAILLSGLTITADAKAAPKYKNMNLSVTVKTKTDVKISWNKQKGSDGYKVYRSEQIKEDKWSKAKKIATLPSTQASLTNKADYKKKYRYDIVSFSKKGKKTKQELTDFCFAYVGVGQADWDTYLHCDAVTTPDSIRLLFHAGYWQGMKPDTYEIYRSKSKKDFKKIASVKQTKSNFGSNIYVDKKVTYQSSYYYKVRAFKILNGKKLYGKFSRPMLLSAVNSEGKFQVNVLTPQAESITSLDILLTSEKGNADAILNSKYVWDASCWSQTGGSVQFKYFYSLDGKEWKTFSEEAVILKPEGKIYIRFESEEGKAFPHPAVIKEKYDLSLYDLSYNRLTCYLKVNLITNTGTVQTNGEYYH